MALAGCLADEEIYAPAGATLDAEGVAVTRLENPPLRGAVYLRVDAELGPATPYTERRLMAPDGAYVAADVPGVIGDGWVWSNAPVRAEVVLGAPGFVAPSVSLPMGGAPVNFSLHTKRGQTRTDPAPPGTTPPLGWDEAVVHERAIALDPRVLVVPVRVHRFLRVRDGLVITRESMSQIFDPGDVAVESAASSSDGFESRVDVVMGRLPGFPAAPDPIWTQCDIQFHLEGYEEIFQTAQLETALLRNTCVCREIPTTNEPISLFLPGRDGSEAFDVFLGGSINPSGNGCSPDGLSTPLGITCGVSNNGSGGSCGVAPGGHPVSMVLLHELSFRTTPALLSHELGHMVGLGHTSRTDPSRSCVVPMTLPECPTC